MGKNKQADRRNAARVSVYSHLMKFLSCVVGLSLTHIDSAIVVDFH